MSPYPIAAIQAAVSRVGMGSVGRVPGSISVQPDGTDGFDAFVYEGNPDSPYGSAGSLGLNSAAGIRRISLIKSDLSGIPEGSEITAAKLHLWSNDDTMIIDIHCSVHAILAANGAWSKSGATWNYGNDGVFCWAGDSGEDGGADAGCSVSGTDYNAAAMGSWTYKANDPENTEYVIDLDIDQVQIMFTNNYGMVLHEDDPGQLIGVQSSNYGTAGNRPLLEVNYLNP